MIITEQPIIPTDACYLINYAEETSLLLLREKKLQLARFPCYRLLQEILRANNPKSASELASKRFLSVV